MAQAKKPTSKLLLKSQNPVKQAREYVSIRLREAAQKARDAGVYDEIVQRMNAKEPLEKIAKDIKKRLDIGIYDVRKMIHGIQAVERLAGGETGFQIRAPQTPEFKAWFGDSKVVDENGQPELCTGGHYITLQGRGELRVLLDGMQNPQSLQKFIRRDRGNTELHI